MDDWALRATLLEVGEAYVTLRNANAFPEGEFVQGEKLELTHVGYSPYDGSHAFTFVTLDGQQKIFWLHDDHDVSKLLGTFELAIDQ